MVFGIDNIDREACVDGQNFFSMFAEKSELKNLALSPKGQEFLWSCYEGFPFPDDLVCEENTLGNYASEFELEGRSEDEVFLLNIEALSAYGKSEFTWGFLLGAPSWYVIRKPDGGLEAIDSSSNCSYSCPWTRDFTLGHYCQDSRFGAKKLGYTYAKKLDWNRVKSDLQDRGFLSVVFQGN